MSKFLRTMTALSKKPSDYKRVIQEPEIPIVQTGTVPVCKSTDPDLPEPLPSRPRVRVFKATRVQDGHSLGEHLIYEVLWRLGQGDDIERIVQIGYDRLAAVASVNWKTGKLCLKSLENKRSIDTIAAANPNERTGTTYRVHCFTTILERRKQAGMEWVEKGRGVRFLLQSGTVPVTTTVPQGGTGTVPPYGTDTVPLSGTVSLLGSYRNLEELTSSSAVATLQEATAQDGILFDDDAARKLIRRCRSIRDDLTDLEIAHFTRLKIDQLRNSKTVGNWIGMLIASVPAYFEGESLQLVSHRDKLQTSQALDMSRDYDIALLMSEQAEVLANPDSSEEDKNIARKILGS